MSETRDAADKAIRDKFYRQWVISRRLAPLAGSFCAQSAQHPMCMDPLTILRWADDLEVGYGLERNFTKDAAAQAAVGEARSLVGRPCQAPAVPQKAALP